MSLLPNDPIQDEVIEDLKKSSIWKSGFNDFFTSTSTSYPDYWSQVSLLSYYYHPSSRNPFRKCPKTVNYDMYTDKSCGFDEEINPQLDYDPIITEKLQERTILTEKIEDEYLE